MDLWFVILQAIVVAAFAGGGFLAGISYESKRLKSGGSVRD